MVEGVTTVCDLGSSLRHISEFEQDYTSTGQPAAHGFRAGPIITVTGGYPSCIYGYSWDYQIATPAEAHAVVIELCNCGADVIKIALEPGHPQHPWPLLSYEQVQAIVTAAHARGVLVRAHIRQAALLDLALAADVDVIEHMPIPFCLEAELEQRLAEGNLHLASYPAYEVQLAKMAAQGVALVPTLDVTSRAIDKLPGLGAEERQAALNFFLEGVCRFHELGGVVALGNDYGNLDVQPGMPIREMELLLAAGLTPLEVIEAATGHAAEVCGHGDELGSLEPGKLADLIVVEGDPLADIQMMSTLRLVIKGGEVVHDLRGERAEPFLNNR